MIRRTKKMYAMLHLAVSSGSSGLDAGIMNALLGRSFIDRCIEAELITEDDDRLYAVVEGQSLKTRKAKG